MGTSTPVGAVDTRGRRVAPRRYRTVEEKIRIVTESRVPGESVADVARRHGVNPNQVFTWRRQQDQGVLGWPARQAAVKLLPVQGAAKRSSPLQRSAPRRRLQRRVRDASKLSSPMACASRSAARYRPSSFTTCWRCCDDRATQRHAHLAGSRSH